jgi:hypothetical protein
MAIGENLEYFYFCYFKKNGFTFVTFIIIAVIIKILSPGVPSERVYGYLTNKKRYKTPRWRPPAAICVRLFLVFNAPPPPLKILQCYYNFSNDYNATNVSFWNSYSMETAMTTSEV